VIKVPVIKNATPNKVERIEAGADKLLQSAGVSLTA
jgi:hypothetical protein